MSARITGDEWELFSIYDERPVDPREVIRGRGVLRDVFAGPGGWDEGARAAGWSGPLVGVEHDTAACATAEAAGHLRILADVAAFPVEDLDPDPDGVLIGSPPCGPFSRGGLGLGALDAQAILDHVARVAAAGRWVPYPTEGWHDERSPLVLEVLRWVLHLRPGWVACEQVPEVLPLWEAFAAVLGGHGYRCWVGVLSAEEYGVPQTRRRAFLLASRAVQPTAPAPSHQAYRPGEPAAAVPATDTEPARAPWVSMAQALGWTRHALVGFPRQADRGDVVELDGEAYRARDLREAGLPSFAVTEKVRSWSVRHSFGEPGDPDAKGDHTLDPQQRPAVTVTSKVGCWEVRAPATLRVNQTANGTERGVDEPAPTVLCSRPGNLAWHMAAAGQTGGGAPRPSGEPAPTVTGQGSAYWTTGRPATTVQGDPRVWPPGHKVNADDQARLGHEEAGERYGDRAGTKAVRVSVQEAGILQSFRPDYPWRGSQTDRYRQVGDAVPPLLAAAILRPLLAAHGQLEARGAA